FFEIFGGDGEQGLVVREGVGMMVAGRVASGRRSDAAFPRGDRAGGVACALGADWREIVVEAGDVGIGEGGGGEAGGEDRGEKEGEGGKGMNGVHGCA